MKHLHEPHRFKHLNKRLFRKVNLTKNIKKDKLRLYQDFLK